MADDIWERAVETYLTIDRGLFLNPQYLIGAPNDWNACADLLAVEFCKRHAWMVEVTTAPGYRLFSKIKAFENEYVCRIRSQLERHKVITNETSAWVIGLWIFAPRERLDYVKRRLDGAGIVTNRVTCLEETVALDAETKGKVWNSRFRDK
jgi:hypothetical protein